MVFPRFISNDLSLFMCEYVFKFVQQQQDLHKFEPKDLLLGKFKTKFNLKEFILEPSVFQHVGFQSSFNSMNAFAGEKDIYKVQFRPFQSYSFMKENTEALAFDSIYWQGNQLNKTFWILKS